MVPGAALLAEFRGWLDRERGLSPVSVRCHSKQSKAFLAGIGGAGAVSGLDSTTILRDSVILASRPQHVRHGCAVKTWATPPPLKTVVLTGSMVSGAREIRSPAPRTTGWIMRAQVVARASKATRYLVIGTPLPENPNITVLPPASASVEFAVLNIADS